MGNMFAQMLPSLFGKTPVQVLVLGLGYAGKTIVLDRFQKGEVVDTIATVGLNYVQVKYNNINFEFGEQGGQISIRPLLRHYCSDAPVIIFVIDSNDTKRLSDAKNDIHAIIDDSGLKDVLLLMFANKQDLPGALDDIELTEALELHKLKNAEWAIFKTCAIKSEGIFEGLDWLCHKLQSRGRV